MNTLSMFSYLAASLLVYAVTFHPDIRPKFGNDESKAMNKRLLLGLAVALLSWFELGYNCLITAALYYGLVTIARYWYEKLLGKKEGRTAKP